MLMALSTAYVAGLQYRVRKLPLINADTFTMWTNPNSNTMMTTWGGGGRGVWRESYEDQVKRGRNEGKNVGAG